MSDTSDNSKHRILLVEDDTFLRDIFSRKLAHEHFDTLTSETGEEALEIMQNEPLDIVLLDLALPGKNGFEILREIRSNEKLKGLLVLILTNSVLSEDAIKSNQLKADDFLTKADFSIEQVIERIQSHIKKKVKEV